MKSLSIYIASSFDEEEYCNTVLSALQEDGHKVPDVWWNIKTKRDFDKKSDLEFYGAPIIKAIAKRHWETIKNVDLVILVSNVKQERSFTGANVEVGYALALGKPVVSIGKLKRSAMYADIIQCDGVEELTTIVNCIALNAR